MNEPWQIELWETPSFEDGFVVVLAVRPREDHCCLWAKRRSRFDLTDTSKLTARAPKRVPHGEGAAIHAELLAAFCTAAPPLVIGLDGTTYTLRIIAGSNAATYHWWCTIPEQWASLKGPVKSLASLAGFNIDV